MSTNCETCMNYEYDEEYEYYVCVKNLDEDEMYRFMKGMFRYILQKNKKVLKGLICSLLHLEPEQIKSVEVTNPIDLSEDINGKDFILDINVLLNDDTQINLEILPRAKI